MTIKVGDFVIIDDMKYHRGPIQVIEIFDSYAIVGAHSRVRISLKRLKKIK